MEANVLLAGHVILGVITVGALIFTLIYNKRR